MNPRPSDPEFQSRLIASFSKYAKSYERHAQLQKSMAERLASLLPEKFKGNTLEIGCGTGIFTRHLLARGFNPIILNDLADPMLEHLKEKLQLPESTRFIQGDAEILKFPKVQLITGNAVFQWFVDAETTLQRLTTCLKPGGQLVFSSFGPKTLKEFRDIGSFAGPTHLHTMNKWKTYLKSAGLQIKKADMETRQIFFPSAQQLLRNLQMIGAAPLRILSPGELKSLIREYDARFATPQGVYTNWELLYISAETL